jgi:DnaA-homolog protein
VYFTQEPMKHQLILDILPNSQPSFDNMVVGHNAQAIESARNLKAGQTLYLWGPDGSGRSHLLKASTHTFGGLYFDDKTSAEHILQCATGNLPMPPLVAIDDMHKLDLASQSASFTLYNRFKELSGGEHAFKLIVAGDRAPLNMPLREDLRTRLGSGFTERLTPLSDQDKLEALLNLTHEQAMPITPEVLQWLLKYGSRDIRVLWGTIQSLDRYALSHQRAITVPLLKTMLAEQTLF